MLDLSSFTKEQLINMASHAIQNGRYEESEDCLAHLLNFEVIRVKHRGRLLGKLTLRKDLTSDQLDEAMAQVKAILDVESKPAPSPAPDTGA